MADYSTAQESGVPKSETHVKIEGQVEEQQLPQEDTENVPDPNAQDGVRIAEAMTLSWSKSSLVVVYIR